MKRWIIVFFLGIFTLFSLAIPPRANTAVGGELDFSGRHYLEIETSARIFYVTGFVHGMSIVRPMAEENAIIPWLNDCIEKMTPLQFEKVLSRYIKKNVALQDARLDVLAFLAFKAKCRKM